MTSRARARYIGKYRIIREALNADGSHFVPPPANPPGAPGTLIDKGFQGVGGSNFSVRLDRLIYGAPQADKETAILTIHNATDHPQLFLPQAFKVLLDRQSGVRQEALGGKPDSPDASLVPITAVAPGTPMAGRGVTSARYVLAVGSETNQQDVRRLTLMEPWPNAPSISFDLPRLPGPSAPSLPAEPI